MDTGIEQGRFDHGVNQQMKRKPDNANMPSENASRRLEAALCDLICINASLYNRLDSAIAELSSLSVEKDFPSEIRLDFESLLQHIHNYRAVGGPGDIQSDIAREIFELYKKLITFTGTEEA
jgi:hypothetical protein